MGNVSPLSFLIIRSKHPTWGKGCFPFSLDRSNGKSSAPCLQAESRVSHVCPVASGKAAQLPDLRDSSSKQGSCPSLSSLPRTRSLRFSPSPPCPPRKEEAPLGSSPGLPDPPSFAPPAPAQTQLPGEKTRSTVQWKNQPKQLSGQIDLSVTCPDRAQEDHLISTQERVICKL